MDLKTLREYEAFLKAIEGRQNSAGAKFKDTFVEVAEAAGKLKEVQKEILRIEEGYNKELKRGIDLSKSFNKSKSDSNIQAAKLLGINNDLNRQSLKELRIKTLAKGESAETVNLANVLNEIAKQEQNVRDNISNGLDEEITQRDIISAIGKENLDKAKEFLKTQEDLKDIDLNDLVKSTADFSKNSSKSAGLIKDIGGGFGAIKGLLPAIGGAFAFIVAQAVDFAKRTIDTRKELGVSLVTSAKLAGQQKLLGTFAKAFGQDAESVAQIQKDILGNLGGQAKLSKELVMDFIQLQGTLGVTSDTASKLIPIFDAVGAAGERGAVAQIESLGALIQLEGLSPGQILGDVASNTEFFAKFAKDGGTNLIRAAVQARKLGLELSAVAGITESLLDFETSIEKQLEASLLLGRQINLDRARQLALTGDQEGLLEEVRRQIGDEAEFNRLNVIQRKALADAFGLQVEQVARAVRGNTAAVTGAAASGGDTGAQQVSLLENIDRGIGKVVGNTAEG